MNYPWIHSITAFISDKYPAMAHRDSTLSSTMEAFALGLVYGKVGPEEGHRHMLALEAVCRMAPKEARGIDLVMQYLETHGFYQRPASPPRRKPCSAAEKEQRLREEGWTKRQPYAARFRQHARGPVPDEAKEERWFPPNDTYSSGIGVKLEQAWRVYLGETGRS